MTALTNVDIYNALKYAFPLELAEHFDNPGFLVGNIHDKCKKILISLDITDKVISEAKDFGANLIVSHHPLLFRGADNILQDDWVGSRVLSLARNGISAICMHTNADSANGGVNDVLANALGLCDIKNLGGGDSKQLGRIGNLKENVSFQKFAEIIKKNLGCEMLKVVRCNELVSRVAVGGGACGDFMSLAVQNGADTFVTADLKYHQFQNAEFLNLNLIDAGHFYTENLICGEFLKVIANAFPYIDIAISQVNKDCAYFI